MFKSTTLNFNNPNTAALDLLACLRFMKADFDKYDKSELMDFIINNDIDDYIISAGAEDGTNFELSVYATDSKYGFSACFDVNNTELVQYIFQEYYNRDDVLFFIQEIIYNYAEKVGA